MLNRRGFIRRGSALAVLALAPRPLSRSVAAETSGAPGAAGQFSRDWLVGEAERLAGEEFAPSPETLPDELAVLDADAYRAIRFRPDARIWGNEGLPFTLDLLHPGFLFRQPVQISIVENGVVREVPFSPAFFEFGAGEPAWSGAVGLGFSGLRVRSRLNSPDVWDEFLVFQGASYFRAVGRDQLYGLSARAVAIDTGGPRSEEFPAFTRMWIEQPDRAASAITIHALADSPSLTGAFTFEASPGAETVIDIEASIFARRDIGRLGLAPLTSMFNFDGSNPGRFDDFRPALHDSDGLQILTGAGEWIWRPLANPERLQVSAFLDDNPRGFGLAQRKRDFQAFQDFEARYEKRPSLWIEPLQSWSQGAVELVEIPSTDPHNDNIVAFWRPAAPFAAGSSHHYAYRMRWTDEEPAPPELLTVVQTRTGLNEGGDRRVFVVDFAGRAGLPPAELAADVWSSAGTLHAVRLRRGEAEGFIRVDFELAADGADVSELRLRLVSGGAPASETWLYRWTAG